MLLVFVYVWHIRRLRVATEGRWKTSIVFHGILPLCAQGEAGVKGEGRRSRNRERQFGKQAGMVVRT